MTFQVAHIRIGPPRGRVQVDAPADPPVDQRGRYDD